MRISLDLAPHPPDAAASVRALLVEADAEFVPPLSGRRDTSTLLVENDGGGITRYAEAMGEEHWLIASDRGRAVGLLSFLDQSAGTREPPAEYVTTVIVTRDHRRSGVAGRLYLALEDVAVERGLSVLGTRTWSTNWSHLALLSRHGFVETGRDVDGRGAGIDTVHLWKELNPESLVRRRLL